MQRPAAENSASRHPPAHRGASAPTKPLPPNPLPQVSTPSLPTRGINATSSGCSQRFPLSLPIKIALGPNPPAHRGASMATKPLLPTLLPRYRLRLSLQKGFLQRSAAEDSASRHHPKSIKKPSKKATEKHTENDAWCFSGHRGRIRLCRGNQ